jgi:nitrogen fixation NifU-like protein
MNEDFESWIAELQRKIEYSEEQKYSKVVIREYRNPTYFGMLDKPDAVGIIKGPCGDTMKISLKINNMKITNARFWTDGCGATIACGNKLIKMIKGKTISDLSSLTTKHLITALDGLPDEHHHCALLSINTLHKAIEQYLTHE